MTPPWALEAAATAATVFSVLLTVRRSLWQYPVGIAATLLFMGVFARADLYASTALQVAFLAVQVYGWWFWMRGDAGRAPPIRLWPTRLILAVLAVALGLAGATGLALDRFTNAAMPMADAAILGLSLGAQFLLDRKVAQHWFVWMAVNVLSIAVYAGRGLELTALLYVGLLANAAWGWLIWKRNLGERSRAA